MTANLNDETIKEALDLGLLDEYKEDYPELFDYTERLAGLPKSFSAHPCGKVISMKESTYYNATDVNKDGLVVLQGDMHAADDLGLIKADFLGLRTIDVIYDTLESIGKDYEYIAPHNIDFNDPEVFRWFSSGQTAGIFQFESTGMQDTLSKMQCCSINDLAVANALYRPGSLKYIDNYANRRKGIEDFEYLHPDLEPILKDTYGIIVFQEQLIEVGRLAKLSNPDELRKATGKKKPELLQKVKPELFDGLSKRGWTQEQFDALWEQMLDFARYSFNKCVSGNTTLIKPATRKTVRNPSVEEMYKITHDIEFAKKYNYLPLRSKYRRQGHYGTALSMFPDGKVRKNIIRDIQPNGVKKVYRVTTKSGKWIECTDNHKFPTPNGYKKLSELTIGDNLYILGKYKHIQYNYNLTDGNFENNFPVPGEMGFQKKPNGESVKFKNFRNHCEHMKLPCEVCGVENDGNVRFEVHHKDKNRHNNNVENLQWCCVSCHKKLDYKLGRTKTYENGIEILEDEIKSIKYMRKEMTYDVTMDDPAHNFVANNGLITCNSHAAAYSVIAYICMYLKVHHTKEFICSWANSVSDKTEKLVECASEIKRIGIPMYLGKYDNCSSWCRVYEDGIMIGVKTIKFCNDKIADELLELTKDRHYDSFIDLLDAINNNTSLTYRHIKILTTLNFFSEYGKNKNLLKQIDIYEKFYKRKQFKKAQLEELGLPLFLVKKHSGKETEKIFKEIDIKGLVNDLAKEVPDEKLSLNKQLEAEKEYLGYCTYVLPNLHDDIYCVVDFKVYSSSERPYITLRRMCDGEEIKTKVKNVKTFRANKFKLYSILRIQDLAWKNKFKLVDDEWVKTDELEQVLASYEVLKQ